MHEAPNLGSFLPVGIPVDFAMAPPSSHVPIPPEICRRCSKYPPGCSLDVTSPDAPGSWQPRTHTLPSLQAPEDRRTRQAPMEMDLPGGQFSPPTAHPHTALPLVNVCTDQFRSLNLVSALPIPAHPQPQNFSPTTSTSLPLTYVMHRVSSVNVQPAANRLHECVETRPITTHPPLQHDSPSRFHIRFTTNTCNLSLPTNLHPLLAISASFIYPIERMRVLSVEFKLSPSPYYWLYAPPYH